MGEGLPIRTMLEDAYIGYDNFIAIYQELAKGKCNIDYIEEKLKHIDNVASYLHNVLKDARMQKIIIEKGE